MIWLRPLRFLPRGNPATSNIQPMDRSEERTLAELRARRAAAQAPAFDYRKAARALEHGLLAFHQHPPQNDAQRAAMLALGEIYSSGLTGPAQDDRLALVLWWCALIEAERGE